MKSFIWMLIIHYSCFILQTGVRSQGNLKHELIEILQKNVCTQTLSKVATFSKI